MKPIFKKSCHLAVSTYVKAIKIDGENDNQHGIVEHDDYLSHWICCEEFFVVHYNTCESNSFHIIN